MEWQWEWEGCVCLTVLASIEQIREDSPSRPDRWQLERCNDSTGEERTTGVVLSPEWFVTGLLSLPSSLLAKLLLLVLPASLAAGTGPSESVLMGLA